MYYFIPLSNQGPPKSRLNPHDYQAEWLFDLCFLDESRWLPRPDVPPQCSGLAQEHRTDNCRSKNQKKTCSSEQNHDCAKNFPAIGIDADVLKTVVKARVSECCRGFFERRDRGWEVKSARVVEMHVSCMLQTLPMHQVDKAVSAHQFFYDRWKLACSVCTKATAVRHDAQQKA